MTDCIAALQPERHQRVGEVAAGDGERDNAVAVDIAADRLLQAVGTDEDEHYTERNDHGPGYPGDRTLLLHRLIQQSDAANGRLPGKAEPNAVIYLKIERH